jgi:pyruvate/2-oxoglutarate dehydrogenase complex dihydrolipoamide acyltransferase (E2) component
VIAAAAKALRAFPVVNSSIEEDNIRYKKDCNIGIAMAVEDGLLVPVLKKVDEKNVVDIARAAAEFAERARARRLTAEDLSEGTFTITNPGVFGALTGTPIINYPQVAILELGAVVKRPVVIQDEIVIRSMAYFSLTYDHRAMDGAVADSFLAHIKKTLETACPPALG